MVILAGELRGFIFPVMQIVNGLLCVTVQIYIFKFQYSLNFGAYNVVPSYTANRFRWTLFGSTVEQD